METAVYLFTGFLEAGKTKFIKETLEDPNFNNPERRYLVILCEEGEEELLAEDLSENVSLVVFDSEDKITPDRLEAQKKRAKADVVVVEYNGMWTIDKFYNALPDGWMVYQEIFIADSTTILSYNANMRQLVVDKLTSCEMVVFNRMTGLSEDMPLHKLVRGVSRKANICYEDTTGEIRFDDIEDPLPFDINAPVIEIKDEDFAIFYRDMTEDFTKYNGKTIRFLGICATDPSLPKGQYAIGRHIMTCCQDDIAYRGVVAKGTCGLNIKTRDWLLVECKINEEFSKLYGGRGPVLTVTSAKKAERPEPEVATFY